MNRTERKHINKNNRSESSTPHHGDLIRLTQDSMSRRIVDNTATHPKKPEHHRQKRSDLKRQLQCHHNRKHGNSSTPLLFAHEIRPSKSRRPNPITQHAARTPCPSTRRITVSGVVESQAGSEPSVKPADHTSRCVREAEPVSQLPGGGGQSHSSATNYHQPAKTSAFGPKQ
jgi:hypothetical protein